MFQYVSDTRILEDREKQVENLQEKVRKQNDSIQALNQHLLEYEKLYRK